MTSLVAAPNSLDIGMSTWAVLKEQATMLVKSGFLPVAIKTPEAAMAIMLKGRELGIPPMQAFAQISVIQGKPAIGSELMLALIYRRFPDAPIVTDQSDATAAIITARRPGSKKTTTFSFTMDDAKRAGLLTKQTWQQYPVNMLYWRCVSNMARALFPDCLMGCSHTPEELGAEVNEEGEVIDVPTAAAAPVAKPVVLDRYDGETRLLKNELLTIAKKYGITQIPDLQVLNHECKGVPMRDLEAAVREWKERDQGQPS